MFTACGDTIAHEINQPLSGIITNAGTCLRMLDGNYKSSRRKRPSISFCSPPACRRAILSFANNQTVLKGFVCPHIGGLSRPACHIVTWSSTISQVPPGFPCNLLARQVLGLNALMAMDSGRGTNARYLCKGDYDDGGQYCIGFGGGLVDRRVGQELLR